MSLVTPIDPLKPHISIAIAYPAADWSKGVYVMGGGYGGESDAEIRAYFEEMSGSPPGTTEAGGWRIVDLPYDHGDWIPPATEPVAYRPCAPGVEERIQMMDAIFDAVLAEDHLPVP